MRCDLYGIEIVDRLPDLCPHRAPVIKGEVPTGPYGRILTWQNSAYQRLAKHETRRGLQLLDACRKCEQCIEENGKEARDLCVKRGSKVAFR